MQLAFFSQTSPLWLSVTVPLLLSVKREIESGCIFAEQLTVVPPFVPMHVQFQGPTPVTLEAVPVVHSPLDGVLGIMEPFAVPHVPLVIVIAAAFAEQLAVDPPFLPSHVQFHGPVPVTLDAVPLVQRLIVGVVVCV